jgi:hypothetical protein
MDFIKFEISDLLKYHELEQLITTPSPTVRATLISTKLLNYILINSAAGKKQKIFNKIKNNIPMREVYNFMCDFIRTTKD